jgi:hypothetical protein
MHDFTSDQPFSESKVYATEMYDYVNDPLEKVNVVNDKKYMAASKDMHDKMVAYFKTQEKK